MRKMMMVVCLLTFGVVAGYAAYGPLNAHTASAISTASSALTSTEDKAADTFSGRISFMDGKYVLVSDTETFQLDDQDRAKAFDGKNVLVTGTLDAASKTIHVADIKAA
ncbi:MAG: hypothetical protein HY508_07460 [Acidobacteria bacterium]|nr:hypothetical protein [Acidobacteriota bacterium]